MLIMNDGPEIKALSSFPLVRMCTSTHMPEHTCGVCGQPQVLLILSYYLVWDKVSCRFSVAYTRLTGLRASTSHLCLSVCCSCSGIIDESYHSWLYMDSEESNFIFSCLNTKHFIHWFISPHLMRMKWIRQRSNRSGKYGHSCVSFSLDSNLMVSPV